MSQPSRAVVPFFQWKLRISPHAGLAAALTVVNCFHWPIGPAQTSGGVPADCRTTAVTLPPTEKEALGRGGVPMASSPFQSDCTALPVALTLANPDSPSTFCANVMRSGPDQVSEDGELLMFGVRLRAAPPAVATTNISPPVTPSSLINPSMNA